MVSRGTLQRGSVREWSMRLVIAAGIAVTGLLAMSHTIAYVLRTRNLEQAYALSSGDARISAQLSTERLLGDNSPRGQVIAKRLAGPALLHDPTAVAAVVTFGLEAELQGNTQLARRIFAYSQVLSRRNLATQLWAIEDAVGRKDIPGALHHYDIALRTSRTAEDLLFPVLSSSISDPEIRSSLISTFEGKPKWTGSFIYHAAVNGADPRATALLFEGMQRKAIAVPANVRTALTNTLIAHGYYENAWQYYSSTRPGSSRLQSRDQYFAADPSVSSPFDWVPVQDGSISTSIQRNPSGRGVFDFAAPPSVGGTVLQQLQLLIPGRYRLRGRSIGINAAEDARPYWSLSCQNGRELGRVYIPNSSQSAGQFGGLISVPSDCPVQTLSLILQSSDMPSGVVGQISELKLGPVSGQPNQ
jgi:hypothetical protein